jgi:hypothetical protein
MIPLRGRILSVVFKVLQTQDHRNPIHAVMTVTWLSDCTYPEKVPAWPPPGLSVVSSFYSEMYYNIFCQYIGRRSATLIAETLDFRNTTVFVGMAGVSRCTRA